MCIRDRVDTALQKAGKPTRYQDDDFSNNKDDYKDKLVGDTCIWLKTGDNTVVFTETGGSTPVSYTHLDVYKRQWLSYTIDEKAGTYQFTFNTENTSGLNPKYPIAAGTYLSLIHI